ncbi:MAG: hypothetical protein HY716_00155 [Planctomycetes bacterium]|nr:hypothetical protein [Planctomycetota bacterium]
MVYPTEIFGRPWWLQNIAPFGANPNLPFIGSFVPQVTAGNPPISMASPFTPWAAGPFGYSPFGTQFPLGAQSQGFNPLSSIPEFAHAQGLRPTLAAVMCPPQVAQLLIGCGLAQPAYMA